MLFLKPLIPTRKLIVEEHVKQGAVYQVGQDCVIEHVEHVVQDVTVYLLALLATLKPALVMQI